MKSAWINYKEIKRIDIMRKSIFTFPVGQEQNENQSVYNKNERCSKTESKTDGLDTPLNNANTETDTDTAETNNSNDSSDKKSTQNLHREADKCKREGIFEVIKKIKEIQTNATNGTRASKHVSLIERDSIHETTDSVELKPDHLFELAPKRGNNLQTKSRFNLNNTPDDCPPPNYNASIITDKTPISLDVIGLLDQNKQRERLIKFGISQLVNTLKTIRTNNIINPLESSINRGFSVAEESKADDSPTECKAAHQVITDVPVEIEQDKVVDALDEAVTSKVIELEGGNRETKQVGISRLVNTLESVQTKKTNEPVEAPVSPVLPIIEESEENHIVDSLDEAVTPKVIELEGENRKSKQVGVSRLVNTLESVQTKKTDEPTEAPVSPVLSIIGDIEEDHVDIPTEFETIDHAITDVLVEVEQDKVVDSIDEAVTPKVIELEGGNGETKQVRISRLVNKLKTIRTKKNDNPLESSSNHGLPVVEETEEDDSPTECKPAHQAITDVPVEIEQDKVVDALDEAVTSKVIELKEENRKEKQVGISRLENTLESVQTNKTDEPVEAPVSPVLSKIGDVEEDHVDIPTEFETIHHAITDALVEVEQDKVVDSIDEAVTPKVIELEGGNSETKQVGISRLVNILKMLQIIKDYNPLEPSVNLGLPVVEENDEKKHMNDSKTEDALEKTLTLKSEEIVDLNEKNNAGTATPTDTNNESIHSGRVYSKTIKSPFSTCVKINDFRKLPIFGEITKNTFEFSDNSNSKNVQIDTKFVSTSIYYPEQPSCQLVSSVIHEIIYLTKVPLTNEVKKPENNSSKSIMNPIHNSSKKNMKSQVNETPDFVKIRVPVVVGEYNIEIYLEEEVLFKEEEIKIKEISKSVVLTSYGFTPTQLSKTLEDGTREASSGILSLKGDIVQKIEYSAMPYENNRSIERMEVTSLHEKITLELVIQLLQEQGIQVNHNDLSH